MAAGVAARGALATWGRRARDALLERPYLWLVAVVVGWDLWSLRATTAPVAYLYDASVHEQMVRFATRTIESGRLPYTAWFPYIGLGSAQYMHYQSLGSVLVGLAGTVAGPDRAFAWSTYLLVAVWPVAVYASARVLGLSRAAATVAAMLSPFVVSYTGIGFEQGAYSWTGGAEVWAQLLGSWALPFAWACSWRAFKDARFLWPASAMTALTIALHFMCGYLALLGIFVMAFSAGGRQTKKLARAAVLFAGAMVAAAWVIIPLMLFARWSGINQALAKTPYVRGYGAGKELEWLFTGQLFDARRAVPVISLAVAVGAVSAVARWRSDHLTRTLLALFAASLMLSFGPTTWGVVARLVPAHLDLYFRRFSMGTQLAGIYLAGYGVVLVWDLWRRLVTRSRWGARLRPASLRMATLSCFAAFALAWSWPAVSQLAAYDHQDASTIATQRAADVTDGAMIAPLISYVKHHDGGRSYAGLSSNWGRDFLVGMVPVYKYLEGQDVDEMTYVVPTLSLMLDSEAGFDEQDPSDYKLFGIRYLFLPTGMSPPVPAQRVMADGGYSLWQISTNGYAELVRVTGAIRADRADVGSRSEALLDNLVPGEDWAVRWPGAPRLGPDQASRVPGRAGLAAPGVVDSVLPDLANGALSTKVDMTEAGTLLISVAYDPGWHAWVDGHAVPTEMLAPALIGVRLAPGRYDVTLRYVGFGWYPELWAAGLAGLGIMYLLGRHWAPGRHLAPGRRPAPPAAPRDAG